MTINCRGKLLDLSTPEVMGILNLTPDSFYDGGRFVNTDDSLRQAEKMLNEGVAIIDFGAMSTKPGSGVINEEEELKRLLPHIENIRKHFPEPIISVDTIHAKVAEEALKIGVHIINDISAGQYDKQMLPMVAKYKAPFIAMHMQGMPDNMQQNPSYTNVVTEVTDFFVERFTACKNVGITDVILDVGFGFGKSVEHNYTLLRNLSYFKSFQVPLLAGVSRKSMICKPLQVKPEHALNGTTAVNMLALINGANILRVHDVKEAKETIKLWEAYSGNH